MTIKEIIDGLKFTVDMFLFDPSTGETLTEPRNDMDKTTIDACKGAIKLIEQTRWIPVSERLPEKMGTYLVTLEYKEHGIGVTTLWFHGAEIGWDLRVADIVLAWMPLPDQYKESEK